MPNTCVEIGMKEGESIILGKDWVDCGNTRLVKKLELAFSLGFTSTPQRSLPTYLSPVRAPILHTKKIVIIREKAISS